MNKPEFRAWDEEKKKFHYSGEIECLKVDMGFWFTGACSCHPDFLIDSECESLPVEQYTGLHDSKDVKIFAGDWLLHTPQKYVRSEGTYEYDDNDRLLAVPRSIYVDLEPVQIGPVSWDETGGWFPFADNDDGMPYPDPARCEVIGDIHQNPEILPNPVTQ